MGKVTQNRVIEYTDEHGRSPYGEWLAGLRDNRAKARVIMQVDRMELGLLGDVGAIGDGLSELRVHHGPGYRVYFGKESNREYLILLGGDKSSQSADIQKAKAYWRNHQGSYQQR